MNTNDILTAINGLLVEKWPTRPVYRENMPKQFARPSFLISLVKETRRDASAKALSITDYITVSIFVPTDGYGNVGGDTMLLAQSEVMELFASGSLAVGDRQLRVAASGGGTDELEAYVDLQVDYLRERILAQPGAPATAPNMAGVNINTKLEG